MKFFMAQNEDGELRIASSSNNTTMDGNGWYQIDSVQNFTDIDNFNEQKEDHIGVYGNQYLTQLVIPSWTDNRNKIHSSNCYFLYSSGFGTGNYYTVSQFFPLSYSGNEIKEAYRLLTKPKSIRNNQRLQYIDYSDKINLINNQYNSNTLITYISEIVIADISSEKQNLKDNLNNILFGQDLFFQIIINPQNNSTINKNIQFDLEIYGFKGSSLDKEVKLFSNILFSIITNNSNYHKVQTINKYFALSKILINLKNDKITKIIIKNTNKRPADNNSYIKSFICYMPYFTWVNTIMQSKNYSGCYLQEKKEVIK